MYVNWLSISINGNCKQYCSVCQAFYLFFKELSFWTPVLHCVLFLFLFHTQRDTFGSFFLISVLFLVFVLKDFFKIKDKKKNRSLNIYFHAFNLHEPNTVKHFSFYRFQCNFLYLRGTWRNHSDQTIIIFSSISSFSTVPAIT